MNVESIRNRPLVVRDLVGAVKAKPSIVRWVNLSVLFFMACLPFNGIKGITWLPVDYFQIKITKIAFLFVTVFTVIGWLKKEIRFRKDYLLFFLVAYPAFNFMSIVNSPVPKESLMLSLAITQYSVLIFVLISVVRSKALLKGILSVMGIMGLCIMYITLARYYLIESPYSYVRLGQDPWPLGIGNSIYYGYILLMYGVGLFYLFLCEKNPLFRVFYGLSIVVWFQVITLNATKSIQAATLLFLGGLVFTLKGRRKVAAALLAMYLAIFGANVAMGPISQKALKNLYWPIRGVVGIEKKNDRENKKIEELETQEKKETLEGKATREMEPVIRDPDFIASRWVRDEAMSSVEVRVKGMVTGYEITKEHPFLGQGAWSTPHVIEEKALLVNEKAARGEYLSFLNDILLKVTQYRPSKGGLLSNVFVSAWAESGAFGFLALFGLIFLPLGKGIVRLRRGYAGDSTASLQLILPLYVSLVFIHQTCYMIVAPWLWVILAMVQGASAPRMTGTRGA